MRRGKVLAKHYKELEESVDLFLFFLGFSVGAVIVLVGCFFWLSYRWGQFGEGW